MVTGRFKAYIRDVDRYIMRCERKSKWLSDPGFLFNLGVIMLFAFNFIDVVETYYSVSVDGRFAEENTLAVPIAGNFVALASIKLCMVLVALGVSMLVKRYSGVYFASLFLWFMDGLAFMIIARNLELFFSVLLN